MSVERHSATIPLSVFKRALRLLWEELFLLGLAGYLWMILGIFILPLAPMTVGLFYVTNQVAHGNAIYFTTQFTGARRFLSRGLIWGALNALAGLLIWADLRYYQDIGGTLGTVFVTLAVLLTLAWIVIQVFILSFLIETGPTHLRAAFRQAFVLVVSQPLFVVGLLIVMALLALLCWYLPIMLGYAFVYLALIANVAVVTLRDSRTSVKRLSNENNRALR
jgi:uncharacterized membrane protein YesL